MIIALCNQKGGVGKSTLTIHLADAIARAGAKVLAIDADPQGSLSAWAASREDAPLFPVVAMARNNLHRDLAAIAGDYAHVVIDSPPRVSALARSAILAADLVLVPVQPSSLDLWAAGETVELVNEAQQFKPDIKAAFVINRAAKTLITRDVKEALADYPFPVLRAGLGQRVSFSEAAAGTTAEELNPRSTAAGEVRRLARVVREFMEVEQW